MDPIYAMNGLGNPESKLSSVRKADGTAPQGSGVAWLASGRGPRVVFAPEGLADITGAAVVASGEAVAATPARRWWLVQYHDGPYAGHGERSRLC